MIILILSWSLGSCLPVSATVLYSTNDIHSNHNCYLVSAFINEEIVKDREIRLLERKYTHRASLVEGLQWAAMSGTSDLEVIVTLFRNANIGRWIQDLEEDKRKYPSAFILPSGFHASSYLFFEKENKAIDKNPKNEEILKAQKHLLKVSAFLSAFLKQEDKFLGMARQLLDEIQESPEDLNKLLLSAEWAMWLNMIFEKEEFTALNRESQSLIDKKLSHIEGQTVGSFHKSKIRQILGFQQFQTPGKENSAEILNFIQLGDPVYFRGFFHHKMTSSGGLPSLVMKLKTKGSDEIIATCQQPMYVPEHNRQEVESRYYFDFALFPDLTKLDIESHLEFIPYINVIEYLLRQPDGQYEIDFAFGIRNELAKGTLYIEIDAAGRQKAKNALMQLYELKIDYVTFPLLSCQNKAGAIPNIDLLKTYGKLLKIDFVPGEKQVMQTISSKEENEHLVKGYAAFQKGAVVELIPVLLKKDESSGSYYFHALDQVKQGLELKCSDGSTIAPKTVGYGYRMRPQNIHNCLPW